MGVIKILGIFVLASAVLLPILFAAFPASRTWFAWILILPAAYMLYQYMNPEKKKKLSSTNKAVFITGCDSGFGLLTAKYLAAEGFKIFAACLNDKSDGAKELGLIKNVHIIKCDVTKDEDIQNAKKYVDENLENSDLWAIVNNAGVGFPGGVEWTPIETYKITMDINVYGPIRVCQAFLPLIRKSKGRVVNVASIAGYLATVGFSSYAMSKHAAVALSDSLRREMSFFGVTVHTIAPGFFKTPILSKDNLLENIRKLFGKAPEGVRKDYEGEQMKILEKMVVGICDKGACPNLQLVVDAISHAVSAKYPKILYRPSGQPSWFYPLVLSLPYYLQDVLMLNRFKKSKKT